MIRIYADFNHKDDQGRVILDTAGSLADIENHKNELTEGMEVLLYMEDEFEIEGILVFDRVWLAIPNFATLHYMNQEEEK